MKLDLCKILHNCHSEGAKRPKNPEVQRPIGSAERFGPEASTGSAPELTEGLTAEGLTAEASASDVLENVWCRAPTLQKPDSPPHPELHTVTVLVDFRRTIGIVSSRILNFAAAQVLS